MTVIGKAIKYDNSTWRLKRTSHFRISCASCFIVLLLNFDVPLETGMLLNINISFHKIINSNDCFCQITSQQISYLFKSLLISHSALFKNLSIPLFFSFPAYFQNIPQQSFKSTRVCSIICALTFLKSFNKFLFSLIV